MQFQEHGSFELSNGGPIVIVDAEGPFNSHLFIRYDKEMQQLIGQFNQQRWANIAILHGLTVFTPDVFSLLNKHFAWRMQNNFAAEALVLVNPEGANILKNQLDDAYNRLKIDFQYFDNVSDARTWIMSKL